MKIRKFLLSASSIIAILGIIIYLVLLNRPKIYLLNYPWQGYAYQNMNDYASSFGLPNDSMDSQSFTIVSDGFAYDNHAIYIGNTILPYQSDAQLLEEKQKFLSEYQNNICGMYAPWDMNTLEVLDRFGGIARDKNFAYLNCQKLKIPRDQIQVLAPYLHTDGYKVFNQDSISPIALDGFQKLGYGYIKDHLNVYAQYPESSYTPMEHVDTETFNVINQNFAKDANHYYYQGQPLANIDYVTFKPFIHHAADQNRAYFLSNTEQVSLTYSIDLDSYEEIDQQYAKDKHHLYYEHLRVPNVNPNNVTHNQFGVLNDGIHVIIDGDIIIDSDPESFQRLAVPAFAKDKNRAYFNGVRIVNADPKTFTSIKTKDLNLNYAKDAKGCFKDNKRSACPTREEIDNA